MNGPRVGLMVALAGLATQVACAPSPGSAVERRTSAIIGGTPVSVDPAGFAFTVNGSVLASGMFLSPGWVITAGHFMADYDDDPGRSTWSSPPRVSADFGTTTSGSQGAAYVHPNWWGPLGSLPPPLGPMDSTYDVGLIHLDSPADGSAYPNKLYNQISNNWPGATLRCYGYGQTNLPGSGGGAGLLQTADFDVTGDVIKPQSGGLAHYHPPSSQPMFTVADSPTGQRLFHGDSGGTCVSTDRSPYVISGIAEAFIDNTDGTHTTYVVDPYYVRYWVDWVMHSAVETTPTSAPSTSVAFTSASTKTGLIRRNYVVATTSGVTPYLNQNRLGGWSGWYALPALTQLPIGFTHGNVGLTVALDGASEPHLWMAVAGKQSGAFQSQNMLVSPNLVLGATPPWPTFTWTSAGSPPANRSFKGNPAIVTPGALGTDRVDYFAYVSDASDNFGLIYTRWKFNGAWQDTGWTALPSIPGVNIKSSPSVGLQGSTYYVAVRGSDNNIWITTLPNVSNSGTYGGPWTDWFALWGQYLGPPALTAWDRGVDVYGIGQDNNLYHLPMDADGSWSDPIQLNATFMNTTALTASNYLPSTHEIAVVGISGSPISPQITRYAW